MAFHISDPSTDAAVRKLAALKGKGLTETVREAVEAELRRERGGGRLKDRLAELRREIAAMPDVDTRDLGSIRGDLTDGL
jgi:antitoxin VapB